MMESNKTAISTQLVSTKEGLLGGSRALIQIRSIAMEKCMSLVT